MPLSAVSERAPTPSPSTRRRKRTWRIVDSDDDGPEILSESLPALDMLSLRERLSTSQLEREAPFVAEATAATLHQTMQEITEKLQPLTKELETLSGPGWRPNPEDLPPQYAMPPAAPPYEVPEPPNWQPAPPALLPPEPPPGDMTTAIQREFIGQQLAFHLASQTRLVEIREALDKKLAWEADRDKAEKNFWDEHQQRHQQQEALRATVVAEKRKEHTDAVRATIASLQMELSKCANQLSRLQGTDALVTAAERHLVRLFEEARRVDGVRRMLQETRCLGEPLDLALEVLHFSDPPLNHFLAPIRPSARFAEVINALRPTSVSIGKRPAAPSVAPSPTKKLRIIPPASPQLAYLLKNPLVQRVRSSVDTRPGTIVKHTPPCQKCCKEGIPCVGFEPDSTSNPHPLIDEFIAHFNEVVRASWNQDVEMVDLGDDLGRRSGAGEDHPPVAFLWKNDDSSDKGEGSAARSPKVDRIHRPRSRSYGTVPSPTAPDSLLPFALSDLLPPGITSADIIRQGASVANPADDFGLPVPAWSVFGRNYREGLVEEGRTPEETAVGLNQAPPCATTFGRNLYRFIPDLLASAPNSHTTAVPPLMPGVSAMGYWPEFPTDPQHRDELLRWINGEYPGFKEEVANLMRLGLD